MRASLQNASSILSGSDQREEITDVYEVIGSWLEHSTARLQRLSTHCNFLRRLRKFSVSLAKVLPVLSHSRARTLKLTFTTRL